MLIACQFITVFDGDKELQIVCGANNVTTGQKVPIAPVNSTLPFKMNKVAQ